MANGYSASLIALIGDLEFFSNTLLLPRWSQNDRCCSLCRASAIGELSYRDFTNNAAWIPTLWKHWDWKEWSQRSQCKLFSMAHLSACNVQLDYMHCKYLGSDMYQYGGALYLLTHVIMENADPKINLQHLWSRMKEWYKNNPSAHRYAYFNRLSMYVRKSGPPKLRGKAVEVKGFGLLMLHLWEHYCNENLELHRQLLAMLKLNCKMEEILDAFKEYDALPPQAHADLNAACRSMCHLHNLISEHFENEDDFPNCCQITSKSHALLHICSQSNAISPRRTWCFTGESFMNVSKTLAQNCCKGVSPFNVHAKMLEHWRLGMHYQLSA